MSYEIVNVKVKWGRLAGVLLAEILNSLTMSRPFGKFATHFWKTLMNLFHCALTGILFAY
jgi:hypothetical protein